MFYAFYCQLSLSKLLLNGVIDFIIQTLINIFMLYKDRGYVDSKLLVDETDRNDT